MNKNRLLFFVFTFVFVISSLNAATILLQDGNCLQTSILEINRNCVYIMQDNEIYKIAIEDLEYIMAGGDDGYERVSIYLSDNVSLQVDLIKYNRTSLVYKLPNEINEIKEEPYKNIVSMSKIPKVDKAKLAKYKEYKLDEMNDISKSLEKIIHTIDDGISIDITSADFYDKYWLKLNKHLSPETSNMLWDLIEVYFHKEKSLSNIYNDRHYSIKKTELSLQQSSDELQTKIYKLRKQFAWRAYKLVQSNY